MKNPQTATVEARMLLLGLSRREVADRAGVNVRTLSSVFTGKCRNERARQKIEWVLKVPIWSSIPEWEARGALGGVIGTDPAQLSLAEIKRLARPFFIGHGLRNQKRQVVIDILGNSFLTIVKKVRLPVPVASPCPPPPVDVVTGDVSKSTTAQADAAGTSQKEKTE